jgi:hypothetical protein
VKAGASRIFHPVPGTPLAYSYKYTLLAYKVNYERLLVYRKGVAKWRENGKSDTARKFVVELWHG